MIMKTFRTTLADELQRLSKKVRPESTYPDSWTPRLLGDTPEFEAAFGYRYDYGSRRADPDTISSLPILAAV